MPLTQVPASMIATGGIPPFDGIKFPATQSASSDANTLDDYEEGTWTAAYGTATNTGTYTKIGNLVSIYVTLNVAGQTFNTITGLPFAASGYFPCSKSRGNGCSVDINTISLGGAGTNLVFTNSVGSAVDITTSGTVRLDIQRTYTT